MREGLDAFDDQLRFEYIALARDLSIVPGTALYGAPTMLVEGLELTTGTARAA